MMVLHPDEVRVVFVLVESIGTIDPKVGKNGLGEGEEVGERTRDKVQRFEDKAKRVESVENKRRVARSRVERLNKRRSGKLRGRRRKLRKIRRGGGGF